MKMITIFIARNARLGTAEKKRGEAERHIPVYPMGVTRVSNDTAITSENYVKNVGPSSSLKLAQGELIDILPSSCSTT